MKSALRRFPYKHCAVQPAPTYRCIENPATRRGFLFPAPCFANEAYMNSEQQTLAELPIWMVIVLSLVGGVSGEMWRADMAGARGWGLIRRLALRSGACVTCGLSTNMMLYALGVSVWAAAAVGCLAAMAGADVAINLYMRWAAKRLGLGQEPPAGSEAGQ